MYVMMVLAVSWLDEDWNVNVRIIKKFWEETSSGSAPWNVSFYVIKLMGTAHQ
jgi:hypothetical protein